MLLGIPTAEKSMFAKLMVIRGQPPARRFADLSLKEEEDTGEMGGRGSVLELKRKPRRRAQSQRRDFPESG